MGCSQPELNDVCVDGVDAGHRWQIAAVLRAGPLIQDALDGRLDVFGSQVAAVVKLDALANVEDVGGWIRNLPALGEQWLEGQFLVEPGQPLVHEMGYPEVGQRRHVVWIEPSRLGRA